MDNSVSNDMDVHVETGSLPHTMDSNSNEFETQKWEQN